MYQLNETQIEILRIVFEQWSYDRLVIADNLMYDQNESKHFINEYNDILKKVVELFNIPPQELSVENLLIP